MMKKAVIFDMDGLMIDSERVTYRCYREVMGEMNYDISLDFYTTLLGKNVAWATEKFAQAYGKDFPFPEVLKNVHIRMNDIFETEGVPVKKGLVELLDYLKTNNYKTIIASSSSRNRVLHITEMAGILKYFDDAICGDEVTQSKPHPEIFLNACKKLGVEPSEALVLEDSEAGILAAHNAAIKVICIVDMKYPDKEYEEKTYQILESLDQVIDLLK